MIVKKNKGGGLAINPNHIFADSTARDAYFALHPTELVKGTFISVGTDYEEYDGTTFGSKTAILQGEPGNAGSIQVGTVTTLPAGSSATVLNIGTTNSAIFDFGIPKGADGAGGGSTTWGGITGTLSAQTDLNSALSGKQATLVSGTSIKTINGTSVLGSGNMVISGGAGAVDSVNGLTGTVVLTQDTVADGITYKQYSQTEKTKLSNITGTNTGDETTSTIKTKLGAGSTSADGYITSTDWNTFNGKQEGLVSGTNIKTINGSSVLGSGDITVSGGAGVTVYADLATIKAVDTTSITSGTLAQVVTLGQFVFDSTSTATGNDLSVIQPTTGSGRWLRQAVSDINIRQTLDTYVAPITAENVSARNLYEVVETDVNGRKMINKQIPAVRSKKVVIVGSSVASGQYATTPLTQAYSKLLEVDMLADTTTPWTLSKSCILGESISTISEGGSRFWNNIAIEKPDIVWLGYAPWNDAINTQISSLEAEKRFIAFEKGMARAVAYCNQIGADYRIMGTYANGQNNGDVTVHVQRALLQHNKRMCDMYKNKYINILGSVAQETGLVWRTTVFGNAGHPSTWGHKMFYYCTDLHDFKNFAEEPVHLFKLGKNQLLLGDEATENNPLYIYYYSDLTSPKPVKISSNYFEVENVSGASANTVLCRITNANTGITDYLILETDADGFLRFRSNSTNTIVLQTAITLPAGKNKIFIEMNTSDLIVKLYLNNVMIGSCARIEGLCYMREFILAGDKVDATKNAKGYAFSNLIIWRGVLNQYERDLLHSEGYICPSNVVYFNDLNIDATKYRAITNIGVADTLAILNSALFTRIVNTDNNYTDAEKAKLANSVSGTFTTNDGKTITVVGGMITSIV